MLSRKKILYLLFLIPTLISAQGYQVNFQGQKQQAMGCAGTALYIDGASLFFNPGSVALSNENSINVAGNAIFANVLYTDAASSTSYRTENPVGTPFSAYGVFHLKKLEQLKFGIAVYTPFGSTIAYEDNWIGRFALTRLKLQSIFYQPTLSYRITPKLGIGAGLVIATGDVELEKDIPVQDSTGQFSHAKLSGKAVSFGFNFGIHYDINEKFSVGLNYRSKVRMNLNNGMADFTVPGAIAANFPDQNFTGSLPLPEVLTLGLAYKPNSKITAVLDINYVGWSAYDTLAFDYVNNTSSLADTKSPRNYKDIVAFRAGMGYKVIDPLELRIGGGFGFSPVPEASVTPETPDGNRAYFTLGAGYKFNDHFSIDVSFYYTQVARTATNTETNLSGTYRTIAMGAGLGLIYKI
jgi:long-chain fatty acid transport protein